MNAYIGWDIILIIEILGTYNPSQCIHSQRESVREKKINVYRTTLLSALIIYYFIMLDECTRVVRKDVYKRMKSMHAIYLLMSDHILDDPQESSDSVKVIQNLLMVRHFTKINRIHALIVGDTPLTAKVTITWPSINTK